MTNKLEEFKQTVREIVLLDNTRSLLTWDQETHMPPQAGTARGEQVAQLTRMLHKQSTSAEYGSQLNELWTNRKQFNLHDQNFLRVKKRSFDLETKIPESLVSEIAKTASLAQQAWARAKKEDDFSLFEPHLNKVVKLNRQKAYALNPTGNAYDTLLDTFEEGLTVQKMDEIFSAIIPTTQEIMDKYKGQNKPNLSRNTFLIQKQKHLSKYLLVEIGYDFSQGNLSEVVHPFMIRLGAKDTRVTNSYSESHLSSLFSALHEGGHALFEQGVSQVYADLLTDDERSLGVHESQSRFWENVIGRSSQFWSKYYRRLQEEFSLDDNLSTFVAFINFVQPSSIRTEADEVTYNLHVFIRYELEKLLIAGELKTEDVPEAWNEKYQDLLGIRPKTISQGCLQDVHWSHATLGYFPTYTLGNVISAQLWHAYRKQNPDYSKIMENGNWTEILTWFRKNVHEFGPLLPTEQILLNATDNELNPKYFVDYLKEKYL